MFTIEKGVPLPRKHRTGKNPETHIPFREMQVGDSVLVPVALVPRSNVASRVKDANKRMRGRWVTRAEGDATRVFRTHDFSTQAGMDAYLKDFAPQPDASDLA